MHVASRVLGARSEHPRPCSTRKVRRGGLGSRDGDRCTYGVLGLVFADGLTRDVDGLSRMKGPVFVHACTPEGFAAAELDPESGTVTWPGGADLAPNTLYERVKTEAWPVLSGR